MGDQRTPWFAGFPDLCSNVTFVPIQFFTVVIPHHSRGTVRIVGFVLRKLLGWVDATGNPTQEQLRFTHAELVQAAGVSRNQVGPALKAAVDARFLRCVRPARRHLAGRRAQGAIYELGWDAAGEHCTHDPAAFRGFCYPEAVVVEEQEGARTVRRPKSSRKNIPNAFFDVVLPQERLAVIRVVGALLFYSIQWGPAGERKAPVSRSITELSRLTGMSRQHVHAAIQTARQRGYIEQVDAGCFDSAAGRESRPATYGIRWAAPAQTPAAEEPPKKVNGPTAQKGERERPKKVNGEQPKMVNGINITTEHKTLEATAASPAGGAAPVDSAAAAVGLDLLVQAGYDQRTARYLAQRCSDEAIRRQIAWLPLRGATRNRLGMLRRAIEQDWPKPEGAAEDASTTQGRLFASHYYAGYHGYAGEATTEPLPKDLELATKFVGRLLALQPNEGLIPEWGRRFGRLLRGKHEGEVRAKPNLSTALVLYGDRFLRLLDGESAARRMAALGKAREAHQAASWPGYMLYLRSAEAELQRAAPAVYEAFAQERRRLRHLLSNSPFLTSAERLARFDSEEARLHAFAEFFAQQPQQRVLGFWDWDAQMNPHRFGIEADHGGTSSPATAPGSPEARA